MIIFILLISLFIIPGIVASIKALQCPNCYKKYKWYDKKRYNMLIWQDAHQRDICKYCAWMVYAKDFKPPKVSYHKWLEAISPLKKITKK